MTCAEWGWLMFPLHQGKKTLKQLIVDVRNGFAVLHTLDNTPYIKYQVQTPSPEPRAIGKSAREIRDMIHPFSRNFPDVRESDLKKAGGARLFSDITKGV